MYSVTRSRSASRSPTPSGVERPDADQRLEDVMDGAGIGHAGGRAPCACSATLRRAPDLDPLGPFVGDLAQHVEPGANIGGALGVVGRHRQHAAGPRRGAAGVRGVELPDGVVERRLRAAADLVAREQRARRRRTRCPRRPSPSPGPLSCWKRSTKRSRNRSELRALGGADRRARAPREQVERRGGAAAPRACLRRAPPRAGGGPRRSATGRRLST